MRTEFLLAVLLAVGLLLGCSKPSPPSSQEESPDKEGGSQATNFDSPPKKEDSAEPKQVVPELPEMSPEELWSKVQTTYAEARSYADNSTLIQRGVSRSRGTFVEVPYTDLTLLFDRPNRYDLTYEDAVPSSEGRTTYQIVCDGKRVRSRANEADGQIQESLAPSRVDLSNFIPEPQLRQAILQVAADNLFPQFALLVREQDSADIFQRAEERRLLPAAMLGENSCYRLEFSEPEGKRVLWIDSERFVLLRMQLPIESQLEQLDPTGQFLDFSVDLDLRDVSPNTRIDRNSFEMEIPEGSRLVRRFVPPEPDPLPKLLGQKISTVDFILPSGERLSPKSLVGKVTLFDFWSTDCQPCRQNTPLLEKAYQEMKRDHEELEFYAVSFDRPAIETEQVEAIHRSWGATFPVCRDPDRTSIKALDVQVTPTLLVAGKDARLQVIHQGVLSSPAVLERKLLQLLKGEDLADQIRKEREKQVVRYEKSLEAATLSTSLVEIPPPAETSVREIPDNVSLEQLWETAEGDLTDVQNLLLAQRESGEPSEVLVLDAQKILLCDTEGDLQGDVKLPREAEENRGFLRALTAGNGRRWYLLSGTGWQRVYLFDQAWNQLISFPDEEIAGIGDVRLVLPKGSTEPTILSGYWGGRGFQSGAPDGRQLWRNDYLDHIIQVTEQLSPPALSSENSENKSKAQNQNRELCCTSTRGTVLRVSPEGISLVEIDVAGRSIEQLAFITEASQASGYCGLSFAQPDAYSVVRFDPQGQEQWHYDLPRGNYAGVADRIRQVTLPGGEEGWLTLAADSSFHLLGSDGTLLARISFGEPIRDFAVQTAGDHLELFLATPEKVSAWAFSWE